MSETRAKKLPGKGKHSKKSQGDTANSKSRSSANMKPMPRTMARGEGSSYAYAVQNSLDDAKNMKGSETGFLGEEKQLIDPKQFVHSLIDKD